MKKLRVSRIEAEEIRKVHLREELRALEFALYGPSAPGSSLNPKLWLTAGG